MSSPDRLGPQPWISDPATLAVMQALQARGGPDCARFVGGAVRNSLRRQPVEDIDIATILLPTQVVEALQAAGLKAVPTGMDHGTITAVSAGRPFEITTLRRDVSTDGRRATVAYTDDWAQDAARRDFCLNAVYADAEGRLFDPTGCGIEDARLGRVRFVGEAEVRIAEDYLRILRFFRFQAWYGEGAADPAALKACEQGRQGLADLSAERVQKELLKLLAAYDPIPSLRLMAATGILETVLPEAIGLERLQGLVRIETEQLFSCDADLRLAALLAPDTPVEAFATRLRLSNGLKDRLTLALGPGPRIVSWLSPREARRLVYQQGSRAFCDRILLAWAAETRTAPTPQWRGLLALAQSWSPPAFPLTGDEILASGVPSGPLVGQVRREVEDWWIDNDFIEDKFSVIERLKAVAQGMVY